MSIISQAFLIVSTVICVTDKKKSREIKRIERKAEGNVKNNKTKNNLNFSISSKRNRNDKTKQKINDKTRQKI